MIIPMTHEEVVARWNDEIEFHVKEALRYAQGEHTALDWFKEVMRGDAEVWEAIVDDETMSFGVVRINHFPQHSELQLATAAGKGWDRYGPEALAYAEDVARQIGCKKVTVWGRPGWQKVMKPYGYEPVYTVMSKEV